MHSHTCNGITAEHTGAGMLVTAHRPGENPLSLATERAAQLHGVLFVASDYGTRSDSPGGMSEEMREDLLSLAARLAHETQVLSVLALLYDQDFQLD
ncbi:hypothetical protein CupriaWKF_07315 [Cupriavidus sp. WKF15]|uniref:hypothetical protein n=1 Tax=Cupriavidus sp. WKF15 TaxID=3032282 RepID=UPI0023E2D2BB|nr:hypothetical protein [Cupriavidus sp. WKF15]WER47347.1 hypothetical protein CupriaWKF_07315 [Cupriavidus sp. WKF15]